MKNLTLNNTHKTSFSGQRLIRMNLLDKTTNKIQQCYFSKLDENDLHLMEKISPNWSESRYGGAIISDFIKKIKEQGNNTREFFILENANPKDANNKIMALAKIKNSKSKDYIDIQYMQSINKVSNGQKLKGAGSALMYGIVKYAQANQKKSIFLESVCDVWYYKLGFKNIKSLDSSKFQLKNTSFPAFFKKIENKYKFTPNTLKLQ